MGKTRLPKFLNGARRTMKARDLMSKGTKFLNSAIPDDATSADLAGCMLIAFEQGRPNWFIERLHGVYNKRRMNEERAEIKKLAA